MKRFEATRNLMNTHKKRKRARENVLKILTKNQFSFEQMLIIKNCNTSNLKILHEMLKNVRRAEIDRIIELIFLIIEQRILHLNRDVSTELFLTTIDTIMITNHSF